MEQVKKIWELFINFLVTYDSHKMSQLMNALKWEEVLKNPYVWLIGLSSWDICCIKEGLKR